MKEEIRIGIDTGGTFTDFVINRNGELSINKIPSVPRNPSQPILEGVREFLKTPSLLKIIHGSTVATNALLERKGAKIALITTKGFEDILSIGRQVRKELYSLKGEKRQPILSRGFCYGIEERTSADGKIEKKVALEELKNILDNIKKKKVQAVAVCLIHSYANPFNEKIIQKELDKEKILSSVSSIILPEYREYERMATTAVNAYLMPVINDYLTDLEEKLPRSDLRIMQSNEGYISVSHAKTEPIRTALSGPAGGVVGASQLAESAGFRNIITFDMGGTSTDVSLVDGQIRRTNESMIGDFPVRVPLIDIHTVGAGGGSIACIDQGGSLMVGPQSAGADPGPACYGRSMYPTVTDANLVLGRLDPDYFLGGKMKIYSHRSFESIEKLAIKINKPLFETATGIIKIANANMERAIRVISIERGIDPRSFVLFSFGGAGGMHAVEIAAHLRINKVVIPRNAGVLSALGLLMTDSIKDYSRSILKITEEDREEVLERYFAELEKKGIQDLKEEGFREEDILMYPFLDLRYAGQSYEITLPYKKPKKGTAFSIVSDFHRAHQNLYSYYHPQRQVEIVNVRLKAVGKSRKLKIKRLPRKTKAPGKAFLKKQSIFYDGRKHPASVFHRSFLEPGNEIKGPALIIDCESTTFLPPSFTLNVDGFLNLVIQKE